MPPPARTRSPDVMEQQTHTATLSRYLAEASRTELPVEVAEAARLHVLDTFAAVISGSALQPGRRGLQVAQALGGPPEAMIVGSNVLVGATAAALANGMAAHADETDDSHAPSLSHPGCAVVPAALAAAERGGRSGSAFLKAVTAGYDAGCRVGRALGREAVDLRLSRPSSHALVGTFGAAAAAAVMSEATALECEYVLSYAAQSASGVTTWQRDVDHIEKAFVFAGGPAQSGVLASLMVTLGCTGVRNVLGDHPDFLHALSRDPSPAELTGELGSRYEIALTNIKRYSVGSPAQAAVQATEEIVHEYSPDITAIKQIDILLPADLARVVDDRGMPDVNVQYLVAGTLTDGRCSFQMSHDVARMTSPPILALRERTHLLAEESSAGTRSGEVRLRLLDGTLHQRRIAHVRGTAQNPMTPDEVREKAIDVIGPVAGSQRTKTIVDALQRIDELDDITGLRGILQLPA
jgi:2-methylcitrate dehydratase PrpD